MLDPLGWLHDIALLMDALLGVATLIFLIARFKINSFVALIIASVLVGLLAGMKLPSIAVEFQKGVGNILSSIAMVIGLGTIVGKMLAESGGASQIADRLIQVFGQSRLHWAVMLIAFIVGLPVFFAVGLVLLLPIMFTLVRSTGAPLLFLAIPMLAALSVAHGLVPPHPGPMVAIGVFQADAGRTILYSILIGLPVAAVAGPIFGRWIARRIPLESPGRLLEQTPPGAKGVQLPPFGLTIATILVPVALMLFASGAKLWLSPQHVAAPWFELLGHPLVALLVAVLVSFYTFGVGRGFTWEQILNFSNECLGPVASVLLVIGAGGGFNGVLIASGVGGAIAGLTASWALSPLILGWLIAALIRVATGSATVAITTAAGIMAPIVSRTPGVNVELLVISMGAGSLILSHVNDGGFWLVKEYLQLSVTETLRTWTVMETIISILALILTLLLNLLLGA